MTINLEQVGKRYRQHWVFKELTIQFTADNHYAILGANGSGKSTLLRIISGMQHTSKGKIGYTIDGKHIAGDKVFQLLSFCAPAMDLIEELSLQELLDFHFTFKKMKPNHSVKTILEALNMYPIRHKVLHEFSSGMKQRVKLAQAFFSDTPLLVLDEPCSNLDQQGVDLYQHWLQTLTSGRLTIIGSNDPREYPNVETVVQIADYQPKTLSQHAS